MMLFTNNWTLLTFIIRSDQSTKSGAELVMKSQDYNLNNGCKHWILRPSQCELVHQEVIDHDSSNDCIIDSWLVVMWNNPENSFIGVIYFLNLWTEHEPHIKWLKNNI